MIEGINSFIQRSRRVLMISAKPREKEFRMMAKTTGLGMILIGLLGFIITLVFNFLE